MNVTELESKGLKKEFRVIIAANDVGAIIDENVKKIGKDVKVQGFRPGKVPTALIKKRYNDTIMHNALEGLVQQNSQKLIQDKKLRPALKPNIEVINFKENEDLEFKISLEVFPDITMPDFKSIKVEKIVCDLNEQDVTEALEKIAKSNKQFEKSDKAKAENGDAVNIDYEGKIDGIAFAGGTSKNHQLELGSKQFIDTFEDQLIGTKVGDKVLVKVNFPENYSSKDLSGKAAEFDVTVNEILTASDKPADNEFAKKFGLADLAELKSKIKEQLVKDAETASKAKTRKELFDKLEQICNFEIPQGMVDLEFDNLWQKAAELKKMNPDYSKKSEEELKEVYTKMAKRRVLLGILLAEVARNNEVIVNQDELRQAIYNQARNYPGQEHAVLDYYRNNQQAIEYLKGPILEDKAVDLILNDVQISERPIPLKDFPQAVKFEEEL
jgi:trigger factor